MLDHIVFISIDTLRSDLLSATQCKLWPDKYGLDPRPIGGVLDELASRSALFTNCITTAPYTSAAHASYFTGQWPLRHGVYEFFNRPLTSPTIFSRACQLGYRTLWKIDFPIILGSFLNFDRDVADYLIEDDDGFLKRLQEEPRTVTFAHFGGLHIPYGFHNLHFGGDAYRNKVEALEAEIPDLDRTLVDQLVETYRDPEDLELLLRYKRIIQHYYNQQDYTKLFALYLEGAEHFFATRFQPFLEKLLARLEGSRFLLVLFGDHGEDYDAESFGHFNTLSEGVLRVPVLFYGEEVKPGLYNRRIRSVDVLPTVLDLLGDRDHRLDMDGVSLSETLRTGADYEERTAYAQAYVSDVREFLDYQQQLLETGKRVGSLRHMLYKDAVYEGPYKLEQQHHCYAGTTGVRLVPCELRQRLDKIRPDAHLETVDDSGETQHLASLLADYGRLESEGADPISVPKEIRQQLQNMGYKI